MGQIPSVQSQSLSFNTKAVITGATLIGCALLIIAAFGLLAHHHYLPQDNFCASFSCLSPISSYCFLAAGGACLILDIYLLKRNNSFMIKNTKLQKVDKNSSIHETFDKICQKTSFFYVTPNNPAEYAFSFLEIESTKAMGFFEYGVEVRATDNKDLSSCTILSLFLAKRKKAPILPSSLVQDSFEAQSEQPKVPRGGFLMKIYEETAQKQAIGAIVLEKFTIFYFFKGKERKTIQVYLNSEGEKLSSVVI